VEVSPSSLQPATGQEVKRVGPQPALLASPEAAPAGETVTLNGAQAPAVQVLSRPQPAPPVSHSASLVDTPRRPPHVMQNRGTQLADIRQVLMGYFEETATFLINRPPSARAEP